MNKSLCAIALLLATIAVGAHGATWYVSVDGSDDNNGSEGSPFETLDRAVDAASDGDTVMMMPGVYSGGDNKVEIDKALTVQATESRQAVLNFSDQDDDEFYVFYVEDDAEVSFVGLKFVGAPTAIVFDEAYGTVSQCEFQYCDYGIEGYSIEETITITNSFFEHVTGTGVDVYGDDDGDLRILSTTFANSEADTLVEADDISRLVLDSVVFYKNRVFEAVSSWEVGEVSIRSSSFVQNYADDSMLYVESTEALSLHSSLFRNNHVDDQGGAFTLEDIDFVRGVNLTVTENTVPTTGGGAVFYNTVGLLDQCEFSNNTVGTLEEDGGGAMYLYDDSRILITDSLLANNVGGPAGGAAGVEDSFLELDGCKVNGNAAVVGGAFQCIDDGRVRLSSDTTLSNNESYSGDEGDCSFK